ncbi:MAG: Coenzyme F420 hydrogenase/dehydrogenase, beta subunit C-terminal domain [Alphaproteobacteria bacterium]
MARIRDLDDIVRHGLCIGCGLCESMAGRERVAMTLVEPGQIRPLTRRPIEDGLMRRILDACPGISLVGPDEARAKAEGAVMHTMWGPIHSLRRCWAADGRVRHKAAAGGALTALGQYLLASGEVDAILHVRASATEPMLTDALVSTTADDVLSGAQSRYGPAAPLVHVMRLLDEGRRFAVIAKPCDIAGIRNLARQDGRVEAQVPYLLSIFCGGVANLETARRIARYHGLAPKDVAVFRWRGEGWPGPTHVEAKDGRVFDLTYFETWYAGDKPWTYDLQFRCKLCPDAIGELADVACPDGWIIEGGKRIFREAPGVNLAVARTAKGSRLVERAAAAGALTLAPCTIEDMAIQHGDHRARKLGRPARALGMRLAGAPTIRARRFRAWRHVLANGFKENWLALRGAFARARAGANRETPPAPG